MLVRRGMLFLLVVCLLAACLPTPESTPTPDRTFQTQNPEMMRPFLVTLEDIGWQGGFMEEVPIYEFWEGEVDYISVNLSPWPDPPRRRPSIDLIQEVLVYMDENTASNMFEKIQSWRDYLNIYPIEIDQSIQNSLIGCSDGQVLDGNTIYFQTTCSALFQYDRYVVNLGTSPIDGSPSYDDWELFVKKAQERLIINADRDN